MTKKSITPMSSSQNLLLIRSSAWASLLALGLSPVAQALETPIAQNTGIETKYQRNQLFINPTTANDATGDGRSTAPLKTR